MTFVNKFSPPEDVEKYRLAGSDKKFVVAAVPASCWTLPPVVTGEGAAGAAT